MSFPRTSQSDHTGTKDQREDMAANSTRGQKVAMVPTEPKTSTFLTETREEAMDEDDGSEKRGDNFSAHSEGCPKLEQVQKEDLGETMELGDLNNVEVRDDSISIKDKPGGMQDVGPHVEPTGSESSNVAPIGSDSQHVALIGSDSQHVAPIGSDSQHVAPIGSKPKPRRKSDNKQKTPRNQQKRHSHQGQQMAEDDDLGIYEDVTEGVDLFDNEDYMEMMGNRNAHQSSTITKTPDLYPVDHPAPPPTSILRNSSAVQEGPYYDAMDDLQNSRVTWNAIEPHFSVSIANMPRHYSGRKANTPASCYSTDSRNASRVTSESREAMFKRAMTLLSARCTSTGPGSAEMPFGKGEAFGVQVPQYFYVKQEKPRPMPPLKAWNGYNGNVYFEPIQINTLAEGSMGTVSVMSSQSTNDKLHRMLLNRKQMSSGKFDRIDSATTRSVSRQTGKSLSVRSSTRQSLVLDKKTVMNGYNENIQDDLALIEGVECTGSLAVRPKSDKTMDKESRRALMYNKERLCKGSVVHRINEGRNKSRMVLKVNGGKFVSPNTISPLQRTQTQYSLSNQRLTTNSPDPYHQQLPPLEQLRASVRHMDTADKQKNSSSYRYSKPVTMTEEIKPFIKYSPDVKKSRQPSYV
ncbi:uncharacterized protein LOC110440374 isoform X1 [Mizuhopecten yessoensis]|uniref:uncharacterized protein LOC110440374 isoform X1 n=2 Tax=Mizuhopecten yessoensis TaxID=6573 RepID=UPI000B45837E|nr:uncharacterized protein LOC110440374 isoform X1 [Mizuhopecten yessoensis]XP_021339091.1 uncharacterized protein LOC110440374 isoform X1 [Mizuhopecten yessoensis]XP_021339092.1 uncharacterized protein LOC110440374 isoform X1 [Mizuhopecten yessoensis]XP_021339093.1 uncharacterized protein LOC110440374 isoform X1 [Mizuhopecten yessoensis]